MTRNNVRRMLCVNATAFALTVGAPARANAQSFISPLIGYDFGGDSGCPEINDCKDKKLNTGIAVGTLGPVLGFELEIAHARNFFGESPRFSSSVLTVMINLMVAPAIGPVRPYGTGGLGLMKTRVELNPTSLLDNSNSHLGWDLGGGLMIFAGQHLGVRGDIRHFHAFQNLSLGLPVGRTKLDFGRASAALVVRF